MKKLKIVKTKSLINRNVKQKKTISALGLGKNNSVVEHYATPQVLGMLSKVKHLVSVQDLV